MMRPGDVAVVISNTGRTRSIVEVARTARENGAEVIGIITARPARCWSSIATWRWWWRRSTTPTSIPRPCRASAALVVVDVLSTAVALRRDEAHGQRFRRMKRRLNELRFVERIWTGRRRWPAYGGPRNTWATALAVNDGSCLPWLLRLTSRPASFRPAR